MKADEKGPALNDRSVVVTRSPAYAACDREPIHNPGAVQPHGVLLALQSPSGTAQVTAASAPPDAPGAAPALTAWLDDDASARVGDLLSGAERLEDVLITDLAGRAGQRWDGVLHVEPQGLSLLELERAGRFGPVAGQRSLLDLLSAGLAGIQRTDDVVAACDSAVRSYRHLTGFDRVMAYRFHPDWSGEVIAESLAAPEEGIAVEAYFGLRFPATDIPAQARALYAANGLRLIPDVRAQPAAISRLDGSADAIDLSRAVLRAVAPVHLHYLENMGVRASMSVAITLPDGTLWGLIACHHRQGPLHVPGEARRAAAILATALSWRVSLCEREAARQATGRLLAGAVSLLDILAEPLAGLPAEEDLAGLAREVAADGLALRPASTAGVRLRGGVLPPELLLDELCGWLETHVAPSAAGTTAEPVLVTDRLPELAPGPLARALRTEPGLPACGLVALPLAGPGSGWLLLFRRELRQLVHWAGDPRRSEQALSAPTPLSPRASFESWQQEVAGRSAVWSQAELAAAAALRDAVADSLLRRGRQIERSNVELRRRNEETRFFADAAVHDLKEPLWQIQVLSGVARQGLEDLERGAAGSDEATEEAPPPALPELVQMLDQIGSSAERMRDMLSDLNRLAAAGRELRRGERHRLRDLAQEAFSDLVGDEVERAAADVSFEALGEMALSCDGREIRRVFQNLLSNALKYRDPSRDLRVVLRAEGPVLPRPGETVTILVEDNGLGFEPALAERLFEPFRRFPPPGAAETDGLGLGLAICQRIVLAHGGSIGAMCRPGQGACFHFTLPEPDGS